LWRSNDDEMLLSMLPPFFVAVAVADQQHARPNSHLLFNPQLSPLPPGRLGRTILTSNNDSNVRLFDAATLAPRARLPFPFAVNYACMRPDCGAPCGGAVAAVVGDDPVVCIVDVLVGRTVLKLAGHRDYAFAAAWHPGGQLLATGNQDGTTMVWDVRAPGAALAALPGRLGAIRSLRWSADGR